MFGWLKRKVQIASIEMMDKDIDRFLLGLRGASPSEVGTVLACAYHWMPFLERQFEWNLDHPDLVMMEDVTATMKVNQLIRQVQKQQPAMASGLMVWLHTLRASATPELRLKGRELWSELDSGVADVHSGIESFGLMLGIDLNLTCFGRKPENLAVLAR